MPVRIGHPVYFERKSERPVVLKDEIPVNVNHHTPLLINQEKPVEIKIEKAVHAPKYYDQVAEKLFLQDVPQEVKLLEQVPLFKTEYKEIDRFIVQERLVEKPVEFTSKVSVPVEQRTNQIVEVPRY